MAQTKTFVALIAVACLAVPAFALRVIQHEHATVRLFEENSECGAEITVDAENGQVAVLNGTGVAVDTDTGSHVNCHGDVTEDAAALLGVGQTPSRFSFCSSNGCCDFIVGQERWSVSCHSQVQ